MMRRSFFILVNLSPVYMPALSPSMETGTIVEWKKKVGDLVKESDVFCTVQTDKAVVDYTNTFDDGYLAKIFFNNGETVPVSKTIAVMVDDEADIPEVANYTPEDSAAPAEGEKSSPSAAPTSTSPPAATASATISSQSSGGKLYGGTVDGAIAASGPAVMRIAARLDRKTLESLKPTGKDGRFTKSDFLGLPGFNYDDAPPPPSSSSSSALPSSSLSSDVATAKSSGSDTQGAAVGGEVVKAVPVYNFKASDTTLLQQLIRSMPVPKPKATAGR